jgi:Holliday junction resolvasome RuvABC endonuclease subunit
MPRYSTRSWRAFRPEAPVGDAADALAIALCHAHHRRLAALTGLTLAEVPA